MSLDIVKDVISRLNPTNVDVPIESIVGALDNRDFEKWRKTVDKHFAAGIRISLIKVSSQPYSRGGYLVQAMTEFGEQITLLVKKPELLKKCEVALASDSVFFANIKPNLHFELGLTYLAQNISIIEDHIKGRSIESYTEIRPKLGPRNGYKPWSQDDDEVVKRSIHEDRGIKWIASQLQRSPVAVASRMVLLKLCTQEQANQIIDAIKSRH